MIGGALLSQGGYGCVFYPEISCRGVETKNKKAVSKIQKKDFSAENEIKIGNIITKASKTSEEKNSFAAVISHCPINVSRIRTDGMENCKIITQKSSDQYIMMKIKYVQGGVLDTFITTNQNNPLIFSLFVSIYAHLLRSIRFLIRQHIVHFDIKGQNIIYNKVREIPVMIDFGLSIPIKELEKTKQFYHYFYVYAPEYYVWPLEVHFFNFLQNISTTPSKADIRSMVEEYVDNNAALLAVSPNFRKNYKTLCYDFLESLLPLSVSEMKEKILSYWDTWDNYSLSILYLKNLYILFGEGDMLESNSYIVFLAQILLTNIHPDPSRRLKIDKNINMIKNFPYQTNIDQMAAFNQLIATITKNKESIMQKAAANSRHMVQLTKQILPIH